MKNESLWRETGMSGARGFIDITFGEAQNDLGAGMASDNSPLTILDMPLSGKKWSTVDASPADERTRSPHDVHSGQKQRLMLPGSAGGGPSGTIVGSFPNSNLHKVTRSTVAGNFDADWKHHLGVRYKPRYALQEEAAGGTSYLINAPKSAVDRKAFVDEHLERQKKATEAKQMVKAKLAGQHELVKPKKTKMEAHQLNWVRKGNEEGKLSLVDKMTLLSEGKRSDGRNFLRSKSVGNLNSGGNNQTVNKALLEDNLSTYSSSSLGEMDPLRSRHGALEEPHQHTHSVAHHGFEESTDFRIAMGLDKDPEAFLHHHHHAKHVVKNVNELGGFLNSAHSYAKHVNKRDSERAVNYRSSMKELDAVEREGTERLRRGSFGDEAPEMVEREGHPIAVLEHGDAWHPESAEARRGQPRKLGQKLRTLPNDPKLLNAVPKATHLHTLPQEKTILKNEGLPDDAVNQGFLRCHTAGNFASLVRNGGSSERDAGQRRNSGGHLGGTAASRARAAAVAEARLLKKMLEEGTLGADTGGIHADIGENLEKGFRVGSEKEYKEERTDVGLKGEATGKNYGKFERNPAAFARPAGMYKQGLSSYELGKILAHLEPGSERVNPFSPPARTPMEASDASKNEVNSSGLSNFFIDRHQKNQAAVSGAGPKAEYVRGRTDLHSIRRDQEHVTAKVTAADGTKGHLTKKGGSYGKAFTEPRVLMQLHKEAHDTLKGLQGTHQVGHGNVFVENAAMSELQGKRHKDMKGSVGTLMRHGE